MTAMVDHWRKVRIAVDRVLLRLLPDELELVELVARPRGGWDELDELDDEDSVFAEVCWCR